jgi:hypothetical protein
MKQIKKIEQLVFSILVIGMAFTTLNEYIRISEIISKVIIVLFFLIGVFYFPFLLFKNNDHVLTKSEMFSYYLISTTSFFYLIFQISQSSTLLILANIVGIANGVMYIFYQISEKRNRPLLIRHIIIVLFLISLIV